MQETAAALAEHASLVVDSITAKQTTGLKPAPLSSFYAEWEAQHDNALALHAAQEAANQECARAIEAWDLIFYFKMKTG